MNSQTRITPGKILSELNIEHQYWAEYAGCQHGGIYFGCRDNRREVEYDYYMKVAIAKLRRLGYNAHRTDISLKAHGVVYPNGFHPKEPQKELGADKIFRLSCTQEIRQQFLKAISSGETVEIDEDLFYYYLDVLPPQSMGKLMLWVDKQGQEWGQQTWFIFAEGRWTIAFWTPSDTCSHQALKQYFCKQVPVGARLI